MDKTIVNKAHSLGITVPPGGAAFNDIPPAALLAGYRAAQWFNFAFVMVGLILALLFLRDIGIIAPKQPESDDQAIGRGSTGEKEGLEDED